MTSMDLLYQIYGSSTVTTVMSHAVTTAQGTLHSLCAGKVLQVFFYHVSVPIIYSISWLFSRNLG